MWSSMRPCDLEPCTKRTFELLVCQGRQTPRRVAFIRLGTCRLKTETQMLATSHIQARAGGCTLRNPGNVLLETYTCTVSKNSDPLSGIAQACSHMSARTQEENDKCMRYGLTYNPCRPGIQFHLNKTARDLQAPAYTAG